ncbi:unnamed protein product, partial [Brenthis ino]
MSCVNVSNSSISASLIGYYVKGLSAIETSPAQRKYVSTRIPNWNQPHAALCRPPLAASRRPNCGPGGRKLVATFGETRTNLHH